VLEIAEVGAELSKTDYAAQVPALRVDLLNAQFEHRDADFPVAVVLAGDDRQGVNELVHLLHEWMDARYLPVHAFGPATDEQRQRPPFWRYWRALPGRGEMALLLGAWATSCVADRLEGRLDEVGLERCLEHIECTERALVDDGVLLLKLWIHLPKKELARRFKKARKDGLRPDERDWRVYEVYDEAMPVVERMLRHTSRSGAPWHVVEGTDARHRNLSVARALLAALSGRLESEAGPARSTNTETKTDASGPVPKLLEAVDLSKQLDADTYRNKRDKRQARLERLWARARKREHSAVLVFEGWDAAGKGGVIRRVTQALDARDYRVVPIAAPTPEEKAHHYLWRFWRQLPRAGRLLIFDRSWYGRVLVERVEGLAREDEWRRAYAEINDFEQQIVEHGIPLLKFWLHIDPDEQMRRFQAREQTPYKKYKITDEDYRNRGRWDDYTVAVNEMVARTGGRLAPWQLVPANDKRWARVEVLDAVCDHLEHAFEKA
jgi:polyphosphate:AMP phosphotransferase